MSVQSARSKETGNAANLPTTDVTEPGHAPPSKEFVVKRRAANERMNEDGSNGNEGGCYEGAAISNAEPAELPPRQNVCQFVLYSHSVLSLCFRKTGKSKAIGIKLEEFGARERIFIFVFVTSCTMAVAMTTAVWLAQGDGSATASLLVALSTILVTLLTVTPLTMLVKAKLVSISEWLRETADAVACPFGYVERHIDLPCPVPFSCSKAVSRFSLGFRHLVLLMQGFVALSSARPIL